MLTQSLLFEAEKYFALCSSSPRYPQLKEMLDLVEAPSDDEDREHEHSTEDGSEFADLTGGRRKKKKPSQDHTNEEILDKYLVLRLEALEIPSKGRLECEFDVGWHHSISHQIRMIQSLKE